MLLLSQLYKMLPIIDLENNLTPVMDIQDPYPWLELDDIRCFQIDRQILESAVDLS